MLKCACKQHTFKQLLLIHNELCTLSSISWNPSSASSGHHIAPSCDVTKLYIVLVIPLKSLIGKKGRSIGRIKSLTCETSPRCSDKRNKLQKCSGCCPQSRCPKTSHYHVFTLFFYSGETWQSFCKHDFQSLDSCLLFRYFSSRPHQSKMLCKWKDLSALWKFEMSAPENACHQLSQIRQTSRLLQGILFFFFCFLDVFLS